MSWRSLLGEECGEHLQDLLEEEVTEWLGREEGGEQR